ncbi:MAG: response regulator [Desulfobacteraceae bacterium]|nr:response regulator [Desulfobacteraceae bacterium]
MDSGNNIRILLIENNSVDARLMAEMLSETRQVQIDLYTADCLKKGLEVLIENSFDLLLMDLNLPDSAGLKSFEKVKQNFPVLPIVIMTGLDDEEISVKAMSLGAQDYIIKGNIGASGMERVIRYAVERKRCEAALHSSLTFLETLINTIPNPMSYRDNTGKFLGCNDAFAKQILGLEKGEIMGRTLFDFPDKIPNDMAKHYQQQDVDLLEKGGVRSYEAELKCADGIFRDFYFNKTVYRDISGNAAGIIAILQDITDRKIKERERKELESHLHQAQKMESIGTLAGGIAHDFNNILSAIIGFSELALDKEEDEVDTAEDVKEILKAGYRAKKLVDQILTFSRQTEQELSPLSVYLIVNEALKLLRSSLPATIEINQNLNTREEILADPTQIHQLVMNLCTNAYHAMRPSGGILEVSLSEETVRAGESAPVPDMRPGQYIRLTVGDTGIGMDDETLKRMFEPYYTTKPTGEGTGLGLAVVHGVVKSHNGFIKVESRVGKGTVFQIFFPEIKRMAEQIVREEEISLPRGTEQVLFVDDEENIINIYSQTLERLGYCVESTTSSTEAMALFEKQPEKYDIVITDMTMPYMTGYDLSREMLTIRPDIPIIMCTGFSETITKEQAMELGIRAFLMKPLLKRNLAETIREVLKSEK